MPESESRLALVIDSTGAQKNSESLVTVLDKMTQVGLEAEKSIDGVSAATGRGTTSSKTHTAQTRKQSDELNSLLETIRPTNKSLAQLDSLNKQLTRSFSKGLINESQYQTYSNILSGLVEKSEKLDDELTGVAQAQRDAAKAAQQLQDAQEAEAQALQRMLDKIDPVSAALRNIERDQQALASALANGKIDNGQFDAYSKSLAQAKQEINGEARTQKMRSSTATRQWGSYSRRQTTRGT